MDATLHQLGAILLRALPTLALVILLHFYLRAMFYKPLKKVLRERYGATEGARKQAEESLKRAAAKTAEYEAAMRAARGEVYQAQEQLHRELQEKETAAVHAARQSAEASIHAAREQLAKDVEETKRSLERDTETVAAQIADSVLSRSAA